MPYNKAGAPSPPAHRPRCAPPLQWLLPDNAEDLSALSPADRKAADAAKARLGRLLAENPKLTHLARTVESKLGIMRMVTIRRIKPQKQGPWRWR